ncbi:MAG: hypothetical protein K0S32_3575 [Bacteroidetes bacterium]|jgi:hypothetical protein|nr:hypothetical protein [Bacteroidota bacterium]
MKNIFLYIALSCSITVFSEEGIGTEKSLPDYIVGKSEADQALKRNEAVFTFTFNEGYNKAIPSQIKMSYNATGIDITPDKKGIYSLKLKPGKYVFRFFHNKDFYEIKTDSVSIQPGYKTGISVHFKSSTMPVICDKPVIYVYPQQTINVNITLSLNGKLNFTYPQYNSCWNFVAHPDGTIDMNSKKYHYIFWDGAANIQTKDILSNEGFIVDKNNLVSFLEEKLGQMGLNSKETADYITYWVPRMNINGTNLVRFLFNEEFDKYAPLNIDPKPDNLFRVFMIWRDVSNVKCLDIKPQPFPCFKREGFTVVEWGGAEIKNISEAN